MPEATEPSTEVTQEERDAVDALRTKLGIPGAARALGIGTDSVLRILTRTPVRRGTVALLRQALARAATEMPTSTKEA